MPNRLKGRSHHKLVSVKNKMLVYDVEFDDNGKGMLVTVFDFVSGKFAVFKQKLTFLYQDL